MTQWSLLNWPTLQVRRPGTKAKYDIQYLLGMAFLGRQSGEVWSRARIRAGDRRWALCPLELAYYYIFLLFPVLYIKQHLTFGNVQQQAKSWSLIYISRWASKYGSMYT